MQMFVQQNRSYIEQICFDLVPPVLCYIDILYDLDHQKIINCRSHWK